MHELANQLKDPFSGTLHLGIIPTLAPYLLPLIMPKLSTIFPQIAFYLVEETTLNLLIKLNEGTLDALLLALPIEGDFSIQPLFEEEFVLALPLKHALAKQKTLHYSELENKTLFLLEEGHCLRDQALAVCHKMNASESKNFRATSLETLRHMVAAGVGMTPMPKLACRANDGVCYVPFTSPAPTRTIGFVWRQSSVKKILLEQLATHIKTIVPFTQS